MLVMENIDLLIGEDNDTNYRVSMQDIKCVNESGSLRGDNDDNTNTLQTKKC